MVVRVIMVLFFWGGAYLHFRRPEALVAITPDWVPYKLAVIYLTGGFEIVAGIALLTRRYRVIAGWLLALYVLAVWPANIKHAVDHIAIGGMPQSWWYHGPRLAFQPVLIWLTLFCAGEIDWPFRRKVT